MNEDILVATMPTTQSFLEYLMMHAGEDAPLGQYGYFPDARGERLTAEMAAGMPNGKEWIDCRVFDGNGLLECFVGQKLEGDYAKRLDTTYTLWCEGHQGNCLEEMVQLPGGAVFRTDATGAFCEIGYLCRKLGMGQLDWEIAVCDQQKGLHLERLDASWTHWGLVNMVLRYNVHGEMTKNEPKLVPGDGYAYVLSSVLNCRDGRDDHLITSVPNATKLKLTGRTRENWTECVLGDGTVGWLFSKFLVKHQL